MTGARELTLALGGRWHGRYGAAPCPVCQPDRRKDQNALTLSDGNAGLLLHCKRAACDFCDILAAAGVRAGDYRPPPAGSVVKRIAYSPDRSAYLEQSIKRLWSETLPIDGSVAETYLRGRGINCALPDCLRFHPECWHGKTSSRWPAMVALVEGSAGFALHRTFLLPLGNLRAGLPGGDKLMIGPTAGGAVKLSAGHSRLVVAEGIETALSLMSGLLPRPAAVWAALSTSGMRSLRLPAEAGHLSVACDGDRPGREAGYALAARARALGWHVSTLDPGDGADFNDVLVGRAAAK